MKKFVLILALALFGAAGVSAQTANLTADGKATTTFSGGKWDLKVDGRTIATGLFSRPTCDPNGTVFIIEKPQGTKTPIDRAGNKVQAQRITQEQIYNETLDRLGIERDEVIEARRAERARQEAEEARKKAETDARRAAYEKAVNFQQQQLSNGLWRIFVRGKAIIDVYGGDFINKERLDRYWFLYLCDEKPSVGKGYFGIIVIDTETGDYTELLPFKAGGVTPSSNDNTVQVNGGANDGVYRYDGSTVPFVFEKIK